MPKHEYYLPQRKLVSQNDAAIIERPRIPRSKFLTTWNRIMSFDAGYLVPFMVDEVLPGDHLRYNVVAYVRQGTLLFPNFSNQRIDTFFFFVPNRILWDNWKKFMGEQVNPADSISFTVPVIEGTVTGDPVGGIVDHMGIPVLGQITAAQRVQFNALPFRAYNRIFNDWFRDENITNSQVVNTGNGPDPVSDYGLQYRAKSHDYFTSALPWPQKFTAPTVPLAGQAPIIGLGATNKAGLTAGPTTVYETGGITTAYTNYKVASTVGDGIVMDVNPGSPDAYPMVFANLAGATGVDINVFRQAFLVQQLLERDARGGTRYIELLKSHFGVTSPDFRLQRPEYIGGGRTPLNITPIAQTTPTGGGGLGALGGTGTAAGEHSANYAATEHGFILGLINIRSELAYQQGLHKMWSRSTRYDYYWPSLSGLGEQAILRQEIFANGTDAEDSLVFGYQERWHEYRTRTSEVTGILRSTAASTIHQWHLAQQFSGAPTLNTTFLQDNPPMARVLAAGASTGQQYLADIMIQRTAVRPIPTYGTPVTLGRF